MMAPGHLQILLEIHCFPYLKQCIHLKHDLGHTTAMTSELLSEGLIEYDPKEAPPESEVPSGYITTEKGQCYIEGMCHLPMPTQTWEIKL